MIPIRTSAQDSDRTRREELLALLVAGDPRTALVERVCELSARLLGVSGAGMCLISGRDHQIIVHGTDPLIEELEDLQITLGQGPCIEAVRSGSPVLVPELLGHHAPTWQAYADRVVERGVRAVFSLPLQAGSVQLGAVDLYRTSPGPLTAAQSRDALLLTELATRSLDTQSYTIHPDGSVGMLRWLLDAGGAAADGSGFLDLPTPVEHRAAVVRSAGPTGPLRAEPTGIERRS